MDLKILHSLQVDYLLRLDTDAFFPEPLPYDPFVYLHERDGVYGYVTTALEEPAMAEVSCVCERERDRVRARAREREGERENVSMCVCVYVLFLKCLCARVVFEVPLCVGGGGVGGQEF